MLTQGLTAARRWDRAARVAGTISVSASLFFRSPSELKIVEGLAAAAQVEQAEKAAQAIIDPMYRARGLAVVASAVASSWPDRARLLSGEAEQLARTCDDPLWVGNALAGIAYALARSNQQQALRLAGEAVQVLADPAENIKNWVRQRV